MGKMLEKEPNFGLCRALLVDDDDFVRLVLKDLLSKFRFKEVIEASNGIDGLALLRKKPDIIICDINMEPLNGIEFLKHVRAMDDSTNQTPIIFLTGDAESTLIHQAITLHVSAYVLKPITAKELKDKVTVLMADKVRYDPA